MDAKLKLATSSSLLLHPDMRIHQMPETGNGVAFGWPPRGSFDSQVLRAP